MPTGQWPLVLGGTMLVLYLGFAATLVIVGRRGDARALAGFAPDCLVLFRRLLADRRLSRRRKLLLAAVVVYLVSPFDLVPDFVPVVGQLDDALIVTIVLGTLLGRGQDLLRRHWPGPASTLNVVLRLASGGRRLTAGRAGGPAPRQPRSVTFGCRGRRGGPGADGASVP